MISRADCLERDAADSLGLLRSQFATDAIDARQLIYLDGNSLGIPPRTVAERCSTSSTTSGPRPDSKLEYRRLDRSCRRVGDKIARLDRRCAGRARRGRFDVRQSLQGAERGDGHGRVPMRRGGGGSSGAYATFRPISTSPTRRAGTRLRAVLVDADDIAVQLDERLAILLLTHVNYRTGRMHPMAEVTRAAHDAGAIWSGTWRTRPGRCRFACTAMARRRGRRLRCRLRLQVSERRPRRASLCLGPSAPHRAHGSRGWRQPLSGWLGHAAPFEFTPDYSTARRAFRGFCAARRRSCRWQRSNAASTP